MVERIVLTSFLEGQSNSTLRWELRKSKPATADDALALGMELKSLQEIEKEAPSTSKVAETSVNAISRVLPEPSTTEWMDKHVRTLPETFKNAKSTQIPESSRPQNNGVVHQTATSLLDLIAPIPKEPERSVSKLHRVKVIATAETTIQRTPKHCERKNHASNKCKACFECGKIGQF